MRQAFLIVVVALWSAPVRGQFSTSYVYYDGQNRSVSSYAVAYASPNTVTNEETISSPDFQAFNQNLVETSKAQQDPISGAFATAVATATQDSQFGFNLSATGGANTSASSFRLSAEGSASSSFQTTFSLLTNTPVTLSVKLTAHVDGAFSTRYSYADATFTLSGGATNISLATNILPGQFDNVVAFPPTQLTGAPGQLYTISVSAAAYDVDGGNLLTYGYGPSNASYSFSLTPVPEPSSIALLLIGSAVLIARAKLIRYRGN